MAHNANTNKTPSVIHHQMFKRAANQALGLEILVIGYLLFYINKT